MIPSFLSVRPGKWHACYGSAEGCDTSFNLKQAMATQQDRDVVLAQLLDELTAQADADGLPDLSAVCEAHPDLAEPLRELWGAVMVTRAVANHSRSSVGEAGHQPSADAALADSLPRQLGDYQLERELGRGGMGVVYQARQQSLDRTVAVKLIRGGELATEEDVARFQAEAEAAADLEHPAIVPIYEIGEIDGQRYFSMQHSTRLTLDERLVAGPMPSSEAVAIVRDIARAVDFAHQRGIVHRDLKPSNILLDEQGRPHVTDFGLAKRLEGGPPLRHITRTGSILGTPAYMAPEQAAGTRGPLSASCDIYSLGTVLYALLTGHPPFQGPTPVDTLLMVLDRDPLPPRFLNAGVDRDLEMIVLKCLQKPPELRYASAQALADDLDAYLTGAPVAARSGRFTDVLARMFRQRQHATVLEEWGLLWMWHGVVLLTLCLVTNWFHVMRIRWPQMDTPVPYLALWGGGLAVWAPAFWAMRCRAGPVTAVERYIAHAWGGSMAAVMLLFVVEYLMGLPVLTLSPVLGLSSGMVFVVKAGILDGRFYLHAAALYATSIVMAVMQAQHFEYSISFYGLVSAATFALPGWRYWRASRT